MSIIVGVDPHKRSHTAAAIDAAGKPLSHVTVIANSAGHRELLAWAQGLEGEVVFAVEDVRGLSGALERCLLEAGQAVVRVAPMLMGKSRRQGRERGKSDEIDALAVARAALREPDLPRASLCEPFAELRVLLEHRDCLVGEQRRLQSRLYSHLHRLEPPIEVHRGALRRKVWLTRVQRQLARRELTMRVRVARQLCRRVLALHRETYELEMEIAQMVRQVAPQLLAIHGCAGLGAARILAEVGDVGRFKDSASLAMHAGVAPIVAASGPVSRHRLNRQGNRKLNAAIYRIAVTQARDYGPGMAYMEKRRAEGKSTREALRCLKRHLVRRVFAALQEVEAQRLAPLPGS